MSREVDSCSSDVELAQRKSTIDYIDKNLGYNNAVYRLGSVAQSIVERSNAVLSRSEFAANLRFVEGLRNTITHQFSNQNSDLSKTFRAVKEISDAFGRTVVRPDSELNKALNSIIKASSYWNANIPKITSIISQNYELYELIRSGQITADQITSGFEEALSREAVLDVNENVVSEADRSNATREIVAAFMSAGSLKGISSPSLKFFVALMIALAWTFGAINQGFDLQKNVGELFTSAKTPADARSLARHPPASIDREKLAGFRVLIGDRVSLREGPGQRYLSTKQLPIGSLLQVLDASEKSWVMVSVAEDGEIYEGWVLRGYTKPIR